MTGPQPPTTDAAVPPAGAVTEKGPGEPSSVAVEAVPLGANTGAAADYPPATEAGRGLFGVHGTGDTSGFGGLVRRQTALVGSPRPYGGDFDEVVDSLAEAYPQFDDAIERVVVDRGELTL